MRTFFTIAALLIAAGSVQAQQPSPYAPIDPLPLGALLLTLPTPHPSAAGSWEVRFSHRFNQSLDQGSGSDRWHSLFGLDGSADIAIGASYAPTRDLELSLLRSSAMDDFELAARYSVVQEAAAIPLSLALRGGADLRTERDIEDRTSYFVQAIASRRIGPRWEVFAVPTFATDAGRAPGGVNGALFDHAFNVPVGAAFMMRPSLSLIGELIPPNGDLPERAKADLGWSVGLKKAVGGHLFEILVTNSIATHVDQYVTSTYQGSPLRNGDLHLGFNIERRF